MYSIHALKNCRVYRYLVHTVWGSVSPNFSHARPQRRPQKPKNPKPRPDVWPRLRVAKRASKTRLRASQRTLVRRHKPRLRAVPRSIPTIAPSHIKRGETKTRNRTVLSRARREILETPPGPQKTGGCRSANFAGGELTESLGAAISSDAPSKTH